MVLISFCFGIFVTLFVHSFFNEPLLQLCGGKLITNAEKETVLTKYTKVANPFFENYYEGFDFFNTKNIYIKNNPQNDIDYSCFGGKDINPWTHKIYLESKNGELLQITCMK